MAFPTSSTRRSLAAALHAAQSQADTLKRIASSNRASMAAGSVTGSFIISLLDLMRHTKAELELVAALPGIDDFAEAQLGGSIAGDFAAMMSAIDAAGAWVIANYPKDATGHLLSETWGANGARVERVFTTAQTAGLRTLLDTLIATID